MFGLAWVSDNIIFRGRGIPSNCAEYVFKKDIVPDLAPIEIYGKFLPCAGVNL